MDAADLLAFVDASPTPFHAVREAARRLDAAGYQRVDERDSDWSIQAGQRAYVIRDGGTLAAFRVGLLPPSEGGFRVVGAHTDSPNLRLKPRGEAGRNGAGLLAVQVYGGVLLHSWFDRDLGLSGRVVVRTGAQPLRVETRLLRVDRPLARVPNLAIHLNRNVNTDGFKVNAQKELPALWALDRDGLDSGSRLLRFVGDAVSCEPEAILGWDLCLHDVQASTLSGRSREFVHAPRLDNLGSTHAALSALLSAENNDATQVITLFDHEEIGSQTMRGADGSFGRDLLRRLAGGEAELVRAAPRSVIVSADMAHAVHPNYADMHESAHQPQLNGGPVVKTHASWRYASEAESAAIFRGLCQDAGVPVQEFVVRTDLACGTTIGPLVSAQLGMRTVDVGSPMLSMHSIREMCGADDVPAMIRAMGAFFGWRDG